ncbi:hypothetical protein [Pontibacillus litoralis]|uniref:Uncharacterized protein n=1 Tax=Pontibacillus litoralis JSM 072002 TaxID=1385512 RepID=A0A0A5G6K2_9BACI|nr:hypothetical protein [Pontibacillus litoralis]KGX86725.1 hypothetical protein N784_03770 [Pontibacillus litoralis JSM 072002]
MMEFLYFPEDKTAYIPAVITLIIFAIGAVIVMRIIINASRKQEQQAHEQFGEQMNVHHETYSQTSTNKK